MANNIEKYRVTEIEDKSLHCTFVISELSYAGGRVQVETAPEDISVGIVANDIDNSFANDSFYMPWSNGAPCTIKNQAVRTMFLIQYRRSE